MLLALGVLAMTVGLIRSEAAADVRTLTATGATSGTRRTLTAATAGGLAFVGVVLGTGGAYIALIAGHVRDLDQLSPIPVVHLAAIVLGTPLVAAGAGWLLAGREPSALARQVIQ
jgi:putative ABC transport system permease protein